MTVDWMKWNEMKWNEIKWKCGDLKYIRIPTRSRLSLTHWPIQPLSRVKSLDGPRVRVISPVGKEKVYGGKDLLKSQVLSSGWNTERVREDASGDSEDGEDVMNWNELNGMSSACHRNADFDAECKDISLPQISTLVTWYTQCLNVDFGLWNSVCFTPGPRNLTRKLFNAYETRKYWAGFNGVLPQNSVLTRFSNIGVTEKSLTISWIDNSALPCFGLLWQAT